MLKLVVVLLALAFVAWRLLPRRRLPWAAPLVVVVVVLVARSIAYLMGD